MLLKVACMFYRADGATLAMLFLRCLALQQSVALDLPAAALLRRRGGAKRSYGARSRGGCSLVLLARRRRLAPRPPAGGRRRRRRRRRRAAAGQTQSLGSALRHVRRNLERRSQSPTPHFRQPGADHGHGWRFPRS